MNETWMKIRLIIRTPFKIVNQRITPKGLFGRSLLIIVVPMIILQTIMTLVFMDRHWQSVTEDLSAAVARNVVATIRIMEQYPSEHKNEVIKIAKNNFEFNITFIQQDELPEPMSIQFFSLLDSVLAQEISKRIEYPFWVDSVSQDKIVEVQVQLNNEIMKILFHRNLASAANWHIFLVWMIVSSIILLFIAILFLRNQIKPIEALAKAAENFGKGRDAEPNFSLRGAQEVRQAGMAFYQMRQRVKRAIEQRTAMLNGVSHDLKTVLTRFRLQLALVPQSKETKALEDDINAMQDMLEAYLVFAKDDTNEDMKLVDVGEMLERFEEQAKAEKCKWEVKCDIKAQVMARPSAMLRLISNIVSNALQVAEKIEVQIKRKNKWFVLEFHDDGPGIKPAMRQEAFRPFVRLDESRNLNSSGSGLGLAIAQDIVHGAGGRIELGDSHLGGLRVRIRIPA